jgi:hypothetical protein
MGIGVPLAVAAGILAVAPWHGPIVLSLSADHGVDAGDLFAFPFVVLAVAVARRRATHHDRRSWTAPAAAIALGTLMLLAGVVAKAGGGPLVPSVGGTFDGTIRGATGAGRIPVDRWSHVAATYDGRALRLYVDGREVSRRAVSGALQTPSTPLWIGGNRPYGEHFEGLIDEVRVYDRALTEAQIRDEMGTPMAPAAGLVAGYAFDAGSGSVAADASENRNTGEIFGARWAAGRLGTALRFDGRVTVVRVPASQSLNLRLAMTLSAWVRPTTPQGGWRTIVQREADAYLLTASSDRENRIGAVDDLRAGLIAAAGLWFLLIIATERSPWTAPRRRSWWLPVALFVLGSIADALFVPSGTLVGPTLVALWLAATSPRSGGRAGFLLVGAVCAGLTVASLADAAAVAPELTRDDGGIARATALGALFAIAGAGQVIAARAPRRR